MPQNQDALLTLSAVGDISLADYIEEKIRYNGINFPFAKVKKIIRDSDIAFGNLENVFTDSIDARPAQAHLLKCQPNHIESISDAGFNIVSLSNNHIMDYGIQGLSETLSELRKRSIAHVGAEMSLKAARMPAILTKKQISIGFLAYSMKGPQSAASDIAGSSVIKFDHIAEDISDLESKVDHIVVSLHTGFEFVDYPHPDYRMLCHKIADLGVRLIIGHHPHVLNGFEKRGNCLIAYSLGNFIFDTKIMDYNTESSKESVVLRCYFNKMKIINYEIVPIIINSDCQPEIAKEERIKIINERIKRISEDLTTKDYPSVYFRQVDELWPKINISVNLKILREQGLLTFLRRIPRIKKIYLILGIKYILRHLLTFFSKSKK